jgi:hypothetical protein
MSLEVNKQDNRVATFPKRRELNARTNVIGGSRALLR